MNRTGQPLVLKPNFKWLGVLGAIGLILFVVFQILPGTAMQATEQQTQEVLTKQEAYEAALPYAEQQLGITNDVSYDEVLVTYQSRSGLYGYLVEKKLLTSYNEQFEKQYPYDVYRVRIPDSETGGSVSVDIHMNTGKPVGYIRELPSSSYTETAALPKSEAQEVMLRNRIAEGGISISEKQRLAAPILAEAGYAPNTLQLESTDESETGLTYTDPSMKIGDSVLELRFTFENGDIRSFEPQFSVPAAHTEYVEKQTSQATVMTLVGYGLFTMLLGVLAVVYSVLTKAYTSFKRGIWLSIFYFLFTMVGTVNLLPTFQAEGYSAGMMVILFGVQALFTLAMTCLVYFSLVAGNGLWRKDGYNLWPQAKEAGYGRYVLNSMFSGYLWAFALLGIQSIIFIFLEKGLGSWSTTDASQSPYNMLYPWLMPLLAWMAGIGEEAVYRLFGIRIFKKMVRSTIVASLITSVIWAMGHTLYPIYPVITRPIELTLIGLIFSFIMIRYGFITSMFSHVIFNSILMGVSLIMMMDAVNVFAGIFWIVLPAIVGYVIYRFNPAPKKKKPLFTAPHLEGNQ
ncbi:type II CAAX endopeptidase family protein [Paenibacillus sp. Marseille-Q4541]|uniref:CPBP family intramembrane glutamic endopeptidase n=1 Tax=Paenibacillus sp. Marseille-Q4541 TaxID=2831522 RepID=UPI001BAC7494|nr:type II CAAX endopeptidase family protein [Paenibacillus sp. Marseille-Q4541]